jgi:hypothetical protein
MERDGQQTRRDKLIIDTDPGIGSSPVPLISSSALSLFRFFKAPYN